MFGRTHGSMFGRTLFEFCVRKNTLHYIRKDTFQNMINKTFLNKLSPINFKMSISAMLEEIQTFYLSALDFSNLWCNFEGKFLDRFFFEHLRNCFKGLGEYVYRKLCVE
jgi:hypothetical protein